MDGAERRCAIALAGEAIEFRKAGEFLSERGVVRGRGRFTIARRLIHGGILVGRGQGRGASEMEQWIRIESLMNQVTTRLVH